MKRIRPLTSFFGAATWLALSAVVIGGILSLSEVSTEARSPARRQLILGNSGPSLKVGLAGAWDLTTDGTDLHGANTLTNRNGVTFSNSDGGDFEAGSAQYLEIADNAALSVGTGNAFYCCAFITIESATTNHNIIAKFGTASNSEFTLYINASRILRLFVSSDGTSGTDFAASTFGAMTVGQRYFVEGWWNPSLTQAGCAVNLVGNTASHATGIYDGSSTFRIGANDALGTLPYFDGLIKYARVWKGPNFTQSNLDYFLTGGGRQRLYKGGVGMPYSEMN